MYVLVFKDNRDGKKAQYDYESLFDAFITEKRDQSEDMEKFAHWLKMDCTFLLSARQIMTYARYILEDYNILFKKSTVRDLKREMKGGAGTVDRLLNSKIICRKSVHGFEYTIKKMQYIIPFYRLHISVLFVFPA
ncbi:MAG TPA: hypothetical protein VFG06_07485 [Thermodesulfovibrionales bacterium]|nr:hypothetical protein [Thermodesulfovibrionales bacterium]